MSDIVQDLRLLANRRQYAWATCGDAADEIERLRGLLREWFEASDPSIGGAPGSLLERTRAAISTAPQT